MRDAVYEGSADAALETGYCTRSGKAAPRLKPAADQEAACPAGLQVRNPRGSTMHRAQLRTAACTAPGADPACARPCLMLRSECG